MDLLVSVNWIALFVLMIALLMFKFLNYMAYKINWTFVVLLAMVLGAVLGVVFTTNDGAYLTWISLIGDVYVNLITALVAPVVMSIFFGLVTGLGKNGGAIFADLSSVSKTTLSAYEDVKTSFDQILLALFPTNVLGDMVNDNIVAIIIIAVAVAVAYVGIASEKGEEIFNR